MNILVIIIIYVIIIIMKNPRQNKKKKKELKYLFCTHGFIKNRYTFGLVKVFVNH